MLFNRYRCPRCFRILATALCVCIGTQHTGGLSATDEPHTPHPEAPTPVASLTRDAITTTISPDDELATKWRHRPG